MIRIDPNATPTARVTVTIPTDDGPQPVKVRLTLLPLAEAAALQAHRLGIGRAVQAGDPTATTDLLVGELAADRVKAKVDQVAAALREWDLADLDGNPLPLTVQSAQAVAANPAFLGPLWDALVETSLSGPRGNA